jgi:hypothetical protein
MSSLEMDLSGNIPAPQEARELTHSLVLPASVIHEISYKLRKRNASKYYFERFDGDQHKTKFWLEEKDGEMVLMSHYPGRSFHQLVMTPEEMFQQQEMKPCSVKGALIEVFKKLGCDVNSAFENAMNLYGSHITQASPVAEKLVDLFVAMGKQNIQPTQVQITSSGAIVLAVQEDDHDRFVALQTSLGIQEFQHRTRSTEEENTEDPVANEH